MSPRRTILVAAILLAAAIPLRGRPAEAKDAYFDVPVRDLKLVEGKLPERSKDYNWRHYQRSLAMEPYVVLDVPGEAYLTGPGAFGFTGPGMEWSAAGADARTPTFNVNLRAAEGQEVKGRLVVVNTDRTGMDVLQFTLPAAAAKPDAKERFFSAKAAYYLHQLERDIPGGAWFRHEARVARADLHLPPDSPLMRPPRRWSRGDELTDTYDLFTGGRAISENLQLERNLPTRPANETPVPINTIEGITIREIDWKPLIKDAEPPLDPLAKLIPFDQHAVFFPSFQAALAVSDETKKHDTPVLRLAEPRAEDMGVVERYQAQLGLQMSTLARMLGPAVVQSVALTGSDPSYPLGTDIAVLLETPQPAALVRVLVTRVSWAAAIEGKDAKPVNGTIDGLGYNGFVSPDRKMSSYIARLGGAVVVTNSLYQLKRLAAVEAGKEKSLAALPEYKFFRIRYPRGDAGESALIFLSDATIRRWCGPRWRIADSRRTRARAVLAELQASQLKDLVQRKVEPGPIHTDLPILGGGEIRLTPEGVVSSVYGTLDFMTPIGEIQLDEVTQDEAEAYKQWRDGYQRNWSWSFDPIGLRIGIDKEKLAADLTIRPLIMNTEYAEFSEISKGASFASTAGDPHQALVHCILALNHESHLFRRGEGWLGAAAVGKKLSLGWVGPSVSLYADEDPFWQDLAKLGDKDGNERKIEEFMRKNLGRLPVALRVDSNSPLQLVAFLAAVRAYVEESGPGLTRWEALKYKEQGYVRISPVKGEPGVPPEAENLAIYYTTVGGALTVTLSERVLQHAIDRALERRKAAEGDTAAAAEKSSEKPAKPQAAWLGSNVALHVDARLLELANVLGREQYEDRMQVLSWNNLPILNEWKRLFPDRDPVAVHRQVWGVALVDPGGGGYVWNERYGTMESTVYGHPGQPKSGPAAPPVLSSFTAADFGLTFEDDGLRARVELPRAK